MNGCSPPPVLFIPVNKPNNRRRPNWGFASPKRNQAIRRIVPCSRIVVTLRESANLLIVARCRTRKPRAFARDAGFLCWVVLFGKAASCGEGMTAGSWTTDKKSFSVFCGLRLQRQGGFYCICCNARRRQQPRKEEAQRKEAFGLRWGQVVCQGCALPFSMGETLGRKPAQRDQKELGFKFPLVIDSYRCSPFSAMEWDFAFEDVMPKGEESLKERWSKGFRERRKCVGEVELDVERSSKA